MVYAVKVATTTIITIANYWYPVKIHILDALLYLLLFNIFIDIFIFNGNFMNRNDKNVSWGVTLTMAMLLQGVALLYAGYDMELTVEVTSVLTFSVAIGCMVGYLIKTRLAWRRFVKCFFGSSMADAAIVIQLFLIMVKGNVPAAEREMISVGALVCSQVVLIFAVLETIMQHGSGGLRFES